MTARLGILVTFACGCWAGDETSVGIFVDFETQPAAMALQVMKKEAAGILRPSGIVLNWRDLSQNRGTESFAGLVVLHFRGKCQVQSWAAESVAARPGETLALATTSVSEGKVLPYSEILCDQVRRTLPASAPGAAEHERQWQLGRALGRVVAHELYHVLGRTTGHASTGLAKARQSFTDLFTGSLKLDASAARALRR